MELTTEEKKIEDLEHAYKSGKEMQIVPMYFHGHQRNVRFYI